jgi:hypothetical protein
MRCDSDTSMAMPLRCPPVVRVPAIRHADEGEPLQPPNPVRPHSDKATGNAGEVCRLPCSESLTRLLTTRH